MEQIIDASIEYSDKTDVLVLWAEPARPEWEPDPRDGLLCIFRGAGKDEVVGVEIVGFSKFKAWDELQKLPVLWRLKGQKPLRTVDLLKYLQSTLKGRTEQAAGLA